MITLPAITADDNWAGTDGEYKNKESQMDFPEHQRIVLLALQQLLTAPMPKPTNDAQGRLVALQNAYKFPTPAGTVLKIMKGIHQVGSNPHIQLKLVRPKDPKNPNDAHEPEITYHLNVARDALKIPDPNEHYYYWVGVQFTAIHGPKNAGWPLVPLATDLEFSDKRRRMSITPDAAKQKLDEIAKQAQAQSDTSGARNAINQSLAANKWTLVDKFNGIKKLLNGENADATTQGKKPIVVRFDSGDNKVKQVLSKETGKG